MLRLATADKCRINSQRERGRKGDGANNPEGIPQVNPAALDLSNEFKVYPNPSAGLAIFEFRIGENGHVKLDIYTMNGKRISRIYDMDVGIPQTVLFEQYLPHGLYPCD